MADTWEDLLCWLETKGFDRDHLLVSLSSETSAGGGRRLIAKRDLRRHEKLVFIPKKALLNSLTLAPLYPKALQDALNATQLISLHLALYRHASLSKAAIEDASETFIPYIRTLPQDFDTVPLRREVFRDATWQRLRDNKLLPPGLLAKTADVSRRFHRDWQRTQDAWENNKPLCLPHLDSFDSLTVENYLWGWLCVNSRCIYQDHGLPTREDNLSLAPIIDGNHVPGRSEEILNEPRGMVLYSSKAQSFGLSSDSIQARKSLPLQAEEIFYSYGAHSDDVLLAEYGFVLGHPANADHSVDITHHVEALFDALGEEESARKRQALDDVKYLGDYYLTLNPDGKVDVSFRLTVALSLLHFPTGSAAEQREQQSRPAKRTKTTPKATGDDAAIRPWHRLVNGQTETLSAENEAACKGTLLSICEDLILEAEAAMEALQAMRSSDTLVDMIISLWKSQEAIAEALRADLREA